MLPTDPATRGRPLLGVLRHSGVSCNFSTWHVVTGSRTVLKGEGSYLLSCQKQFCACVRVLWMQFKHLHSGRAPTRQLTDWSPGFIFLNLPFRLTDWFKSRPLTCLLFCCFLFFMSGCLTSLQKPPLRLNWGRFLFFFLEKKRGGEFVLHFSSLLPFLGPETTQRWVETRLRKG